MRHTIWLLITLLSFGNSLLAKEKNSTPITISMESMELIAPEGDTYTWYLNDTIIENRSSRTLAIEKSGTYSVDITNGKKSQKVAISIAVSGKKIVRILMAGDSTMADYTLLTDKDYMTSRYPLTGWGQVFAPFFTAEKRPLVNHLLKADSVIIIDKAVGGRSSRSFFQEGRWRELLSETRSGDFVIIQFGHNDATPERPNRYVTPDSYKEFLRLYVSQVREKGATPILVTPMAQNKRWEDGKLLNTHGQYPAAMKAVAEEMGVYLIDLNQLSMDFFTQKGEEFVTYNYFMNLPAGKFASCPDGKTDNTHFQTEGAKQIARLVFEAMCQLHIK